MGLQCNSRRGRSWSPLSTWDLSSDRRRFAGRRRGPAQKLFFGDLGRGGFEVRGDPFAGSYWCDVEGGGRD